MTVGAFSFEISPTVLVEISGLADEELKMTQDKHLQQTELDFSSFERIGWDGKYILREGLPQPWSKVVGMTRNYFTLNTQMT